MHKELNSELNIVFGYLRKLGITKEDAEDAVQESAYKYLIYNDSIQISKTRSWLIRVALNFYFDRCRKQNRYDLNLNEDLLEANIKETPETVVLEKERKKEIGYALSLLKPQFQEILLLKYQSELSYKEISKLLEVDVGSVKTILFRARKKLAKVYKEVYNGR